MGVQLEKCIFCGLEAQYYPKGALEEEFVCDCPNCGIYHMTAVFKKSIVSGLSQLEKSRISGYIREINESNKKPIVISSESVVEILHSSIVAHTILAKSDKLILYLYRKTEFLGQELSFDVRKNFAILYAINVTEAFLIIEYLVKYGYIVSNGSVISRLTHEGFQYAENLSRNTPTSTSAFVAMWFSPVMFPVYDSAIKPAIESEECGSFKAFRVDNHEHNNDITDEIIAGIKSCRFMVADLTGYRGGVYYEAGFARGLGKPVIFTCRKDWFDGELSADGKPVKEKVHFDINHQNIIVWENESDLKQRIINRIRATII